MTQAYNLAILANAVDSSGKLNVATNSTGTLPVANGGTGQTTYTNGQLLIGNTTGNTLTKATLTQGSGITITNGAGTITIAASGSGTVTSVATGNGLSGGTITSTGTLVVACPTFNSVGSYTQGGWTNNDGGQPATGGTNYSAGSGNRQMQSASLRFNDDQVCVFLATNNLSGTWKWMGSTNTGTAINNGLTAVGVICRVS